MLPIILESAKTDNELWQYGKEFYTQARAKALALAEEFGVSLDCACGVIAVLSPNNSWEGNLKDARRVFQALALGAEDQLVTSSYPANKRKALRIAKGEPVSAVLGGPKVTAFFQNIRFADEPGRVTVDFHMKNAAEGKKRPMKETPGVTREEYSAFSAEVLALAERERLLPQQAQAIIWLKWKRITRGRDNQLTIQF